MCKNEFRMCDALLIIVIDNDLTFSYKNKVPALLMGNIVILKIPTVGGLAHFLTMEAFAKALPAGTIHFISGSGRETMPPLMKTGLIDGLAFIGGASAADSLIKDHPHPHRLKVFLQLEGKNMAIFLSDIFQDQNAAALDHALNEVVVGSLSFNGQRCTALKIIFVPREYSQLFLTKLRDKVEALKVGLPWERSGKSYSQITPLPNSQRIAYMKHLIQDAISKGASIVNANGGAIVGGPKSTLMIPAVVFPVDDTMDLYSQEQFGPVVPVVPYDTIETAIQYGRDGSYGQQCSIFTSEKDSNDTADILDRFSSIFGKININSQCGRSPDILPFSGRRSSAMGVMSVTDALKEFSVPTVVSYKKDGLTELVMSKVEKRSQFLAKL
jgi:glyceraldehyde-3-phosphate dehydrogenase (NADP+)